MKFFRVIPKTDNKVLGRWALESCDKKINSKIDWSNTDHCGPCGTEKLTDRIYSIKPELNKQISS